MSDSHSVKRMLCIVVVTQKLSYLRVLARLLRGWWW